MNKVKEIGLSEKSQAKLNDRDEQIKTYEKYLE
jgi:hypothetical protein